MKLFPSLFMPIRLFAICLLLMTQALYAAPWQLRTAARDTPPYYEIDADGKPRGACPDLFVALEKQLPELLIVDQKKALSVSLHDAYLERGKLDLLCGFGNSGKRKEYAELLAPLWGSLHQIAVRRDDPIRINSIDELREASRQRAVLVRRNSSFANYLQSKDIHIDESTNEFPLMLRMLQAKRGRILYYDKALLASIIERAGMNQQLRIAPTVFARTELYFMVAKSVDPQLRAALRLALQQLEANGTLSKIRRKYHIEAPEQ
ncbi:substrate-binding periplasmic protein [Chitinibacter sp. S2-10]|uniref:substrate-binding periplasmic protein n=1 Tax=Chitinibacter sp. S2-10 TaxID=3373597 RepID=UPI003977963C